VPALRTLLAARYLELVALLLAFLSSYDVTLIGVHDSSANEL
jgi:hypothetical protein